MSIIPLLPCLALENNSTINLKTGDTYIIPLKNRPLNLQNSNTRIVKVDAVSGIFEEDSSIMITTIDEGISYITFKQKDLDVTIKLLIDNQAKTDNDLLILDKPDKIAK